MIVNPEILKELRISAGSDISELAKRYVLEKKVNIKKVIYDNQNNFEIKSKVRDNGQSYDAYIQVTRWGNRKCNM